MRTLLLIFLAVSLSVGVVSLTVGTDPPYIPVTCKKISPCVCKDEHGRYVDLRPLARNDGTPQYRDHPTAGSESNLYSFNPCFGFDEGNDNRSCQDVAVCKVNQEKTDFMGLGRQDTASFGHHDNGNLSVTFYSACDRCVILTTVILYCAEEVDQAYFRVIGYVGDNSYWLQLRSKHCCPKNESEIPDLDSLLNGDAMTPDTEVTMPTIPTPGVVTMTASPNPSPHSMDAIVVILLSILLVAILILGVLAGAVLYFRNKHPMFGRNVYYQSVSDDDEADIHFDKCMLGSGKDTVVFNKDVYGQLNT